MPGDFFEPGRVWLRLVLIDGRTMEGELVPRVAGVEFPDGDVIMLRPVQPGAGGELAKHVVMLVHCSQIQNGWLVHDAEHPAGELLPFDPPSSQ